MNYGNTERHRRNDYQSSEGPAHASFSSSDRISPDSLLRTRPARPTPTTTGRYTNASHRAPPFPSARSSDAPRRENDRWAREEEEERGGGVSSTSRRHATPEDRKTSSSYSAAVPPLFSHASPLQDRNPPPHPHHSMSGRTNTRRPHPPPPHSSSHHRMSDTTSTSSRSSSSSTTSSSHPRTPHGSGREAFSNHRKDPHEGPFHRSDRHSAPHPPPSTPHNRSEFRPSSSSSSSRLEWGPRKSVRLFTGGTALQHIEDVPLTNRKLQIRLPLSVYRGVVAEQQQHSTAPPSALNATSATFPPSMMTTTTTFHPNTAGTVEEEKAQSEVDAHLHASVSSSSSSSSSWPSGGGRAGEQNNDPHTKKKKEEAEECLYMIPVHESSPSPTISTTPSAFRPNRNDRDEKDNMRGETPRTAEAGQAEETERRRGEKKAHAPPHSTSNSSSSSSSSSHMWTSKLFPAPPHTTAVLSWRNLPAAPVEIDWFAQLQQQDASSSGTTAALGDPSLSAHSSSSSSSAGRGDAACHPSDKVDERSADFLHRRHDTATPPTSTITSPEWIVKSKKIHTAVVDGKIPTEVFDQLSNRQKRKLFTPAQFPYFCAPCQKGFVTQDKLDDHVAAHLCCPFEGCSFVCRQNLPEKLELHVQLQHTGEKKEETAQKTEDYLARRRKRFPTSSTVESEIERCLWEWYDKSFSSSSSPSLSTPLEVSNEKNPEGDPIAREEANQTTDVPPHPTEKDVLSNGQKRWLFYHLQNEAHQHLWERIPAEASTKMKDVLQTLAAQPILSDSDEEEEGGKEKEKKKMHSNALLPPSYSSSFSRYAKNNNNEQDEWRRGRGRGRSTVSPRTTRPHRGPAGGQRDDWRERRREYDEADGTQRRRENESEWRRKRERSAETEEEGTRREAGDDHAAPPPPPPARNATPLRSMSSTDTRRMQVQQTPPPPPLLGGEATTTPPSPSFTENTNAPSASPPLSSSSPSAAGTIPPPTDTPSSYTVANTLDPSASLNHISKELVDALWTRAVACHDAELISIVEKLKDTP